MEHSFHGMAEGGWGVSQPKEHHIGLICSKGGFKSCLPAVFFLNLDVIEPSPQIEFGEQGLSLETVNDAANKG
jgi:hypothetical protein